MMFASNTCPVCGEGISPSDIGGTYGVRCHGHCERQLRKQIMTAKAAETRKRRAATTLRYGWPPPKAARA